MTLTYTVWPYGQSDQYYSRLYIFCQENCKLSNSVLHYPNDISVTALLFCTTSSVLCFATVKAGLHYQSFCDRSLSANTVLDKHQGNRRL